MQDKDFFQQLGLGIASLTFGAALSIFIYAFASGLVSGLQSALLYATSFLLMLRFWWKYTELFIRFFPSQTFWHFLFDFLISFFGILAVLFVGNIQIWALIGMTAMTASAVRCRLSWKTQTKKEELKRTIQNSFGMLIALAAVYFLSQSFEQLWIAATVFILVLGFVIYATLKKK